MDDEPYLRKLIAKHLSNGGYRVTTVTNGDEAIAAIEQSLNEDDEFAIAVIDLTIPGAMGGQEAIAHIRRLSPNLFAVASSGYSADPIMAEPLEFGFSASLPKPFALSALDTVLETAQTSPA
jgi:CheY-like chemotaxis protein